MIKEIHSLHDIILFLNLIHFFSTIHYKCIKLVEEDLEAGRVAQGSLRESQRENLLEAGDSGESGQEGWQRVERIRC